LCIRYHAVFVLTPSSLSTLSLRPNTGTDIGTDDEYIDLGFFTPKDRLGASVGPTN